MFVAKYKVPALQPIKSHRNLSIYQWFMKSLYSKGNIISKIHFVYLIIILALRYGAARSTTFLLCSPPNIFFNVAVHFLLAFPLHSINICFSEIQEKCIPKTPLFVIYKQKNWHVTILLTVYILRLRHK